MVMVVPRPGSERTSNSSISRLAPGRPSPRPPEVEKPSCNASETSRMPGPWSSATTTIPCRSPSARPRKRISPRLAYMRMLRAISEMAAAITVWSPISKPHAAANSRPLCRALTMSTSDRIGTLDSSGTVQALLAAAVEEVQAFLEVEGGGDSLQRQPQLHHGEGDLGLNPDDHRLGAPQPGHVCDVAERAHRERVHHVERRHIHDHAARAKPAHPLDQRLPQLREVRIRERRLDRGDQVIALFQDRDFHRTPSAPAVRPAAPRPAALPCTPAAAPPLRCPLAGRPPSPFRSDPHRS